jgi:DnaJ-class molecular chaperone
VDERKRPTDNTVQPTVVGQPSTMSPGDQVPPGTPGSGENLCPRCGGKGRLQGDTICTTCNGTGLVTEAVGGGG